jgi:hypothetical protein
MERVGGVTHHLTLEVYGGKEDDEHSREGVTYGIGCLELDA